MAQARRATHLATRNQSLDREHLNGVPASIPVMSLACHGLLLRSRVLAPSFSSESVKVAVGASKGRPPAVARG